jgi:hypothetical protein
MRHGLSATCRGWCGLLSPCVECGGSSSQRRPSSSGCTCSPSGMSRSRRPSVGRTPEPFGSRRKACSSRGRRGCSNPCSNCIPALTSPCSPVPQPAARRGGGRAGRPQYRARCLRCPAGGGDPPRAAAHPIAVLPADPDPAARLLGLGRAPDPLRTFGTAESGPPTSLPGVIGHRRSESPVAPGGRTGPAPQSAPWPASLTSPAVKSRATHLAHPDRRHPGQAIRVPRIRDAPVLLGIGSGLWLVFAAPS